MKLTAQEIDRMEAGRELDAVVDELCFGFDQCDRDSRNQHIVKMELLTKHLDEILEMDAFENLVPNYSTSIADAWPLVEKYYLDVSCEGPHSFHATTGCSDDEGHDARCCCFADAAPLAICRAALKCEMEKRK